MEDSSAGNTKIVPVPGLLLSGGRKTPARFIHHSEYSCAVTRTGDIYLTFDPRLLLCCEDNYVQVNRCSKRSICSLLPDSYPEPL